MVVTGSQIELYVAIQCTMHMPCMWKVSKRRQDVTKQIAKLKSLVETRCDYFRARVA